ncbi:MAG TPA: esterase-like activity of phytase family protein [Parvibaculum sp.]|jgi:hypothetical protein
MAWRRTNRHLARGFVALALLSSGCAASAADKPKPVPGEPVKIELASQPIRWNPDNRNDFEAGDLEWAGTIEVSSDHKQFGGWSSLAISADGSTLLSVSDEAQWFTAQILYDEKGRLSGLGEGTMAPLLGLDGKPIKGKAYGDAEGLAVAGDPLKGDAYVSFERHHRIWRYDLGHDGFKAKPVQLVTERGLGKLPWNEGIEALATRLPETGGDKQPLLAISENGRDPRGNVRGFLIEGKVPKRFSLKLNDPFRPTDLARLPNGDYLLLERSFSLLAGAGMQLRRIIGADIKPNAVVESHVLLSADRKRNIDNMEGLAVRKDEKGNVWVYVISDDNFSPLQHTYLMMFRLKPDPQVLRLPQSPAPVGSPAAASPSEAAAPAPK